MDKARLKLLIMVFVLIVCLGLGCKSQTGSDNSFTYRMNFVKAEFDQKYARYTKQLPLGDHNTNIDITAGLESGIIKLQLITIDSSGKEEIREYIVEEKYDARVEVDGETIQNLTAIVECFDDTQGWIEILVSPDSSNNHGDN